MEPYAWTGPLLVWAVLILVYVLLTWALEPRRRYAWESSRPTGSVATAGEAHTLPTSYYSHSPETQIGSCWVLRDGSEQMNGITKAPVFRGLELWKQKKDCRDPASVQSGEMVQVHSYPSRPWNRPFLFIPTSGSCAHPAKCLKNKALLVFIRVLFVVRSFFSLPFKTKFLTFYNILATTLTI